MQLRCIPCVPWAALPWLWVAVLEPQEEISELSTSDAASPWRIDIPSTTFISFPQGVEDRLQSLPGDSGFFRIRAQVGLGLRLPDLHHRP